MNECAEAVAEAFVRAINRQDVDALAGLMTEEHRFIDSLDNVEEGRDRMREAWKSYFGMVPDYTIAVEETYCDGPIVVLLGTAQGTYSGGGGIAAENRWETPVALRAFVEDGKIAEWRVYADNEPMRRLMARGEKQGTGSRE
jgi:uncharacterized protein (TIGR02246 family)